MKIIKNILLLLLILFIGKQVFSQKLQPVRLEVPSEINADNFHVEMLAEKGALIFYESNEVTNDNQRKWFFGLFNTSLKQQWLKFIPLADKLEFIGSDQSDSKLFLLFRNLTRGRSEDGSYEIVTFNILSNEFSKVTGTFPNKAEIAGFNTIGNTGCLALNIHYQETDLLFIDLITGDIKPAHLMQDADSYIFRLQADKQNRKFYTALKVIKDNRYITDKVLRFSSNGVEEYVYDIAVNENLKSISNYYFVPRNNNQLRVFGTYDIITERINSFKELLDNEDPKSVGMYYLEFDEGKQSALKFYDFLGFDNIYGSLGNRTLEYKKTDNQNAMPKEKSLSAYYHLFDPQVMKIDEQYIFSVEVYKPFYTLETRMDYDFYGRPMPYSYNVFGGYDFYDVIVVGLSEEGDLIWNNDFAINDLRTFELHRNSIVFNEDEFISIAYVNKGYIHLQTIEGPVDIGKVETEIESKFDKDRVAEDQFNQIKFWYDNYFLIYGYQKLKNRTLDDQSVRTAFYVNKVAYN